MEHLIEPLKNLGLSEKEAKIYLALLQLGPATPYQIAKKAEIKRPTAYVIAEELVEKGLIVHVPGESPKKYIARTPDSFFADAESKLQKAKSVLPELRSFQRGTAEKPSIMYYEGPEGVRQAYEYRKKELHGKEIVGFFASPEDATPEVTKVFLEWNEYKEKYGPKVRGLTVDDSQLKDYVKYLTPGKGSITAKFMPPELYSAKASIEACDGKFVRICLIESAEALIIESPKFAEAMQEVFELLWKGLEGKYDEPRALKLTQSEPNNE
ncbi:MAG: helix-turn-helix domain-containing protein [Candidatus Moraniibacteriota bacterium]